MIAKPKINEERKAYYYEQGYWTEDTILDVWNDRVLTRGAAEYVVDDQGARLTYADVDAQASRLASWLAGIGVCPRDVVSFQVPVWSEFVVVVVACLKVGAVMHPLSMRFNAADIAYALSLVESSAFICAKRYHGRDFEEQVLSVLDSLPLLKGAAVIEHGTKASGSLPVYEDILTAGAALPPAANDVGADDAALILSTSGTTGKPKAVLLTHNNLLYSERQFTLELGLDENDIMFMPAPLNHATGFNHGLLSPLVLGGKVVLMQDFHVPEAIELMNREKVTWSMGATPFIYDILRCAAEGGPTPETLRFYLCGGAPVPGPMVHQAREQGIILCEVYGSTESCPHVFVPPAYALGWNGKFSGRPFKGIEVRVVDDQGNDVAPGEQGEELSRGPNVFVGYHKNETATREALDEDGWFYSGDLCTMDERGRIRINGRKKEIIIRGGENVSTREVDEAVLGCPGIGDLATIGMPDTRLGERICLYAVPADPTNPPSLDKVLAYLEHNGVAKRLWPEHLELIETIPRTESGKVKRNQLADDLAERLASYEHDAHDGAHIEKARAEAETATKRSVSGKDEA